MHLKHLQTLFWAVSIVSLFSASAVAQPRGAKVEVAPVARGPERRIALVLGNNAYPSAPLKNPCNDARDVAAAVEKLGFEVTTLLDADYQKTSRTIREFVDKLQPGDVVFFYYSGHGIGYNGKNYLLPVDASIKCLERIDDYGITLGRIWSEFEQRQVRNSFLFLDACRNIPDLKPCQGNTRALTTQGLVTPTNNPRGSLTVFATEEGTTADDNNMGKNGLFTGVLLEYLTRPGWGIRQITDSTLKWVDIHSNGLQRPVRHDRMLGDFTFVAVPKPNLSSGGSSAPTTAPNSSAVVRDPPTYRPAAPTGAFASVKAAGYKMGAANRPYNEQPPHDVRVNGFQMGRYEVTVKEWKEYCQATKRAMPTVPDPDNLDPNKTYWNDKDRHPITNVTWFEAVEYANWLSDRHSLRKAYQINDGGVEWDRTANGYRLPTEAEWELAARGNSPDLPYPGNRNELEVSWSQNNSDDRTHPVGGKKPNDLNLYDMAGNVWEWCWDWYDEYYYRKSEKDNPIGVDSGTMRSLRGGSWLTTPNVVTFRRGRSPRTQSTEIGFRLVRGD